MLAPQRLGCNLPAAGWSVTKLKIISEPKYIEMGATKCLIADAEEGGRLEFKESTFSFF